MGLVDGGADPPRQLTCLPARLPDNLNNPLLPSVATWRRHPPPPPPPPSPPALPQLGNGTSTGLEGLGFCAPDPAGGTFGSLQYLQVGPAGRLAGGLGAWLALPDAGRLPGLACSRAAAQPAAALGPPARSLLLLRSRPARPASQGAGAPTPLAYFPLTGTSLASLLLPAYNGSTSGMPLPGWVGDPTFGAVLQCDRVRAPGGEGQRRVRSLYAGP